MRALSFLIPVALVGAYALHDVRTNRQDVECDPEAPTLLHADKSISKSVAPVVAASAPSVQVAAAPDVAQQVVEIVLPLAASLQTELADAHISVSGHAGAELVTSLGGALALIQQNIDAEALGFDEDALRELVSVNGVLLADVAAKLEGRLSLVAEDGRVILDATKGR